MSADPDRLDQLAASVSDGGPIDWNAPAAQGEESGLAALRDLSEIAEFNRRLQRPAGGDAGDLAERTEPKRWGDLLLLAPLGSGASGEVWRAWDPRLEREVALKFLQTPAGDGASALLAEARAVARVRHPGVVAVYGIDQRDGRVGMWMEMLPGETLAAAIERRGALPPAEVAKVGREIAAALGAVHEAGLVHRDVKPANVVLEPSGRVVLTDFGLGRHATRTDEPWRVSGTPVFMAPELLAGAMASPRTDLYALGVTLWWALAGRCPFAAQNMEALRSEAATGPRTRLGAERGDAPQTLTGAIERAMAPAPENRFASASDLARALELGSAMAAPRGRSTFPRTARWALAAVTLSALVVAAWLAMPRTRPAPDAGSSASSPAPVAQPTVYDVEATLMRRSTGAEEPLAQGDRVRPGDRLTLTFRATRSAWVYVLNEDERGECYLLFPQPLFDRKNPIAPGAVSLPGTVQGRENAWTVTSRGGREHFLVVASPDPLPEIEAELARLPAAIPGRPIRYAAISPPTVERLRGVGAVSPVPAEAPRSRNLLDRFAGLAGRETNVQGVWVRKLTLENPLR